MKPTVINSSNSEPHPVHHEQPNMDSNNAANAGPNAAHNDQSRRFPQFRQHGFGFDDPDDDVFANMGLRSRLNRMHGNPFDWSARKRRGSGQNAADQYDHYFHDDVDFPHFGSTWDAFNRMGNKRSQHPSEVNDRSGFFDYLPPEFRQYMPDNFGFSRMHHPQQQMHPQYQQQVPPQNQQPHDQNQSQQQQQQQPTQQSNSKTNLCDAAIQTEDIDSNKTSSNNDQESPDQPNRSSSGGGVNRSGSNSSASASSSSRSTPYGNQTYTSTSADGPGACASASAGNNGQQHYQQTPPHYNQQGRHFHPYPQHQYGYQAAPPPQQSYYYGNQQPQPQQQQQQQQQQQPHPEEGHVRTVPIFFEGSSTPVATAQTQATANKPRPEPFNKDTFQSNQPQSQQQQQQKQEQQHSEPPKAADQKGADEGDAPPQTPHTADCIQKIQAIQRDVLDLMCAVEQFGGKRGDKEYKYLDEMLTRNLLKLDTIDTNGKESIRLARKEAIKCIQASIAVLEAKSDLHLNKNEENADKSAEDTTKSNEENEEAAEPAASTEKMDVEKTEIPANAENGTDQPANDSTANEIPVENIKIDDESQSKEVDQEMKTDDAEKMAAPENGDKK